MDTFINTLPLESGKNVIIQTNWSDTDVTIKLCDSSNDDSFGYTAVVPLDSFESSANELEIPSNEFVSENKRALTVDGGQQTFVYQLNVNESIFSWRKVKDSGLKIVYGSVDLTVRPQLRHEILIESIQKNREQCVCIAQLTEDFELFKVEHEHFRQAFEKLVVTKKNLETDLLTKFIVLLNTKKDKIRELEAKIKHFGNNDADASRKESQSSYGAGSDTDMECGIATGTHEHTIKPTLPRRRKFPENQISTQPCTSESIQPHQKVDSPQPSAFECDTEQLFDDM